MPWLKRSRARTFRGMFVGQTPFYLPRRADIAVMAARLKLQAVYVA